MPFVHILNSSIIQKLTVLYKHCEIFWLNEIVWKTKNENLSLKRKKKIEEISIWFLLLSPITQIIIQLKEKWNENGKIEEVREVCSYNRKIVERKNENGNLNNIT